MMHALVIGAVILLALGRWSCIPALIVAICYTDPLLVPLWYT